jgi:hypothetical protein
MKFLLIAVLASWMNIAAYTFDDVIKDIVPGRKGADAVRDVARLLERTSIHHKTDPETVKFRKFILTTVGNFDFMKLYENPYFKEDGNGFRMVRFQGCNKEDYYQEQLVTSDKIRCEKKHAWDYTTEYALKKNDRCIAGGQSFIVSVKSTTATERFSDRNALMFAEGILKVIDPVNIGKFRAPESSLYDNIEGESRRVINEFHRSFPKTSELFNRYSVIRSFLEIKRHKNIAYTRLALRYGYHIQNLEADLPEMAKSLKSIEGLYRITMTIKNIDRHTIMVIVFDSREDALSLEFFTRRGSIIPFDEQGNPLFSEAITLTSLKDITYYATLNMLHDVHGLKFATESVVVQFRYQNTPARGLWTMKLEDVSRTRISGSYYHIIPGWLIDFFIPNNMEQMIYDLSRVMLKGNDGLGSMITFAWDRQDPKNIILNFTAASEFMNNYFLKYGLGVWSKKTISNDTLIRESRTLMSKFLDAFMADFKIAHP